jgi:simple sugar transport system substrate-binding protein
VVTCHVDGPKVVVETAEKRGAFSCGYHASQAKLAPKGYLTGAEWDWTTPYKLIIKAAMEGKPHPNFVRGGLKDGFVKPSPYGKAVSPAAKKTADEIKAKMVKGEYVIFKGPLKDNKGGSVIASGTAYEQTNVALESMNYLVDGVVGQIPG